MKNALIIVFVLFALASTAEAQRTCTKVTATSQNCVVTVTGVFNPPDAAHVAATGLIIRRSDAGGLMKQIGAVGSPTTAFVNTFTDAGNVEHCWDLIGTNGNDGSIPSPPTCWTTPLIPSLLPMTPGAPILSSIARNSVVVSWIDNSDNEKGFAVIRRQGAGGAAQKVMLAQPDAPTILDAGLKPRTTYRYQVAAFNENGFSDLSGEVVGITKR